MQNLQMLWKRRLQSKAAIGCVAGRRPITGSLTLIPFMTSYELEKVLIPTRWLAQYSQHGSVKSKEALDGNRSLLFELLKLQIELEICSKESYL